MRRGGADIFSYSPTGGANVMDNYTKDLAATPTSAPPLSNRR
jgi:hypothetical protein